MKELVNLSFQDLAFGEKSCQFVISFHSGKDIGGCNQVSTQ